MEHSPKLATPKSDYALWQIAQGEDVEHCAQRVFPNGINVEKLSNDKTEQLLRTKDFIEQFQSDSDEHTLYQAAFEHDQVLVVCDILRKRPDGTFELYEVKSFSDKKNINEKDNENFYINDLCIQTYVLEHSGLRMSRVALMYLDKDYHRTSSLAPSELFCFWDLPSQYRENISSVAEKMGTLKTLGQQKSEPIVSLGSHCNKPQTCDFHDYCLSQQPNNSIYRFSGRKLKYPKKHQLIADGQSTVQDIDLNNPDIENVKLELQAEQTQLPYIDQTQLNDFLSHFHYPLFFLDFETIQYAIPQHEGNHPFSQLPFQFSIHRLNHLKATPEHLEFFWTHASDPTRACAKRLCELAEPEGSIIAYSPYESSIINQMAKSLPDMSMALTQLSSRVIDISKPFADDVCYLPGMYGSYSIKKIVPLIDHTMDYQSLDIGAGDDAMSQYRAYLMTEDPEQKSKIAHALRDYCAQDTLAMVKIYQWLIKQSQIKKNTS